MEIVLDLSKTLEENAADYFDKAKKAKKKLEGAKKALEKTANRKVDAVKKDNRKVSSKKDWFEKFYWCISSKGRLMIGGRDATTNEILVKSHSENNDLAFHTDMKGSPFVILKDGINATSKELDEAANLCLIHSQGWKKGISIDVFYVKPEQLSKQGRAGEAAPAKGGFVVLGETKYLHPPLDCAVGMNKENKIMGGAVSAIKTNCKNYVEIFPGNEKTSDVAKRIAKFLKSSELDDIIRVLPAGGCKLGKFF